jgi:hypothetical protein
LVEEWTGGGYSMAGDMSEPWPLDEPGEDEMVARRTLATNLSEPSGALAAAIDCITRFRTEIERRRQELHDLRNDLHGIRMLLGARDAELAQLRAEIERSRPPRSD